MRVLELVLVWVLVLGQQQQPAGAAFVPQAKPVPLLLPLPNKSSKLALAPEGLELLRSLQGPVAPVVVIGPYRSGKSFLLNQLLSVPCDTGFGVGHTRATQTKGIWVWGAPLARPLPDGTQLSVLFVDTEGFESTGRSSAYDDRIFAVSTLLSSLLLYNLPEAIRESDIAKLSFAVQLAQGLYDRGGGEEVVEQGAGEGGAGAGTGGQGSPPSGARGSSGDGDAAAAAATFQPGAMLWVIQRDFLQGANASAVVAAALAPVPNPRSDPEVHALNAVRASLAALAPRSAGMSLVQPHLERTRLCELEDAALAPTYVAQREALRALVMRMAQPKMLGGAPASGQQLADMLVRLVDALNAQEIPNVVSMLEAFNRELASRCAAAFRADLAALRLPQDAGALREAAGAAQGRALAKYRASALGAPGSGPAAALREELRQALAREAHLRAVENEAASNAVCGRLEGECEEALEGLQAMRLPSLWKYNTTLQRCADTFHARCTGPARAAFDDRLQKAGRRATESFHRGYNDRLFMGLLMLCLGMGVVFRFVLRSRIGEVVGWGGAIFLQLSKTLQPGSLYDTQGWSITARVWEVLMFVFFGFDYSWALWLVLLVLLAVRRWRQQRGGGRGPKGRGARDARLDV